MFNPTLYIKFYAICTVGLIFLWQCTQIKFGFKILALEDQEQEARNLDFWEPTDSEDSDQQDGGRGQPLPPLAVPRGTHDISTSEDETSPPRRQDRRPTPASSRQGLTWASLARSDSSSREEL